MNWAPCDCQYWKSIQLIECAYLKVKSSLVPIQILFEQNGNYNFDQGRHFNFLLEGEPIFFYIFQCHRTIEKLEKKQHFICSNLTLFIVPFFLFSSFFLFFLFFFFFFLFFSFSLGGGGGGRRPPAPSNDAHDFD